MTRLRPARARERRPTMRLRDIAIDAHAIEQGEWVDDLPGLDGVRVLVRGIGNADYRRLQAKLMRKVTPAESINGMSPERGDEITTKLLAETVLLGWEGIEDDDGAPLAYSKEKAVELLADPALRRFRDGVMFAATTVGERRAAQAEADAKN